MWMYFLLFLVSIYDFACYQRETYCNCTVGNKCLAPYTSKKKESKAKSPLFSPCQVCWLCSLARTLPCFSAMCDCQGMCPNMVMPLVCVSLSHTLCIVQSSIAKNAHKSLKTLCCCVNH